MPEQTDSWQAVIEALKARRQLSPDRVRWAMTQILQARFTEGEATAFLLEMRVKGETADELATAAEVLREYMLTWDPGTGEVMDTCGTGGDQSGTFNISTATALVLAAAGVRVVKHGNRAVSSQSGSADVLTALGLSLDHDPTAARRRLDLFGLAFCFAPSFHPAVRHVAAIRKQLGVATLFNCLGPLGNPAGAQRQLLGVGRHELVNVMAGALARLGTTKSFVIHSEDGLDEISLAAPTLVGAVRGTEVTFFPWRAEDFGLAPVSRDDLQAQSASQSAYMIRDIFGGKQSPAARVILANAAAGLLLADRVNTLPEGVALAREVITRGAAADLLNRFVDDQRSTS